MACSFEGSCLTLSSQGLAFREAETTEAGGGPLKTAMAIGNDETVDMPPQAPKSQWLCHPADVPLPCWRAPRAAGLGLSNPHALCFMNAVLQALAYTPGLADDCLEERHRSSCFSRCRSREGPPNKGGGGPQDRRPPLKGGAPSLAGSRDHGEASVAFCAFCKLEQQLLSIHRRGGRAPAPKGHAWVANQLAVYIRPFVWRAFRPGRQEDAHEFFRFLLDALMKAPSTAAAAALQQQQQQQQHKREVKPEVALTSYFGRLFGSWLRSSVICSECRRASVRFESAIDIPLDIGGGGSLGAPHRLNGGLRGSQPQKPFSLEKALARFISKETLSGNNAYMCQRCSKKVTATKQLQLFTTPKVLVLALKRFSLSLAHGFPLPVKCHRPVAFPARLNVLPFVAPDAVKAHQQQLQQHLQQQLQQQLKLPGSADKSPGSAGSTTASSPNSSPPYSPNNASPSLRTPQAPAASAATAAAAASISSDAVGAAAVSPSYLYRLYAVVAHSGGSMSSGHYRAFVRAPSVASQLASHSAAGGEAAASWLAIDDEMVSAVSEAAVLCRLQQEAYLLFYAKIPSKGDLLLQQHEQQDKQQQQEQEQQDRQMLLQQTVAAATYVTREEESDAASAGSLEPELSTSEDEWSDCSSSSSSSSISSSSSSRRDSEGAAGFDAVVPLLKRLRATERRRQVSLSRRRRALLTLREGLLLKHIREARREALGLPQQQQQQQQQQKQQQQQPRLMAPMTAEMMAERKKAAASRKQQFGCSSASRWEEEEEAEAGAAEAAAEQQLFERLQTLQQPLPRKRSRHDREYDMGRLKKVKDPERHKPVGAPTVVKTQGDSSASGTLIVQQRAAFDCLQQQKQQQGQSCRPRGSQKRSKLAADRRRGPPGPKACRRGRWRGCDF